MMYTLAEQKNKEETVTDLEKGAAGASAFAFLSLLLYVEGYGTWFHL